MNNPGTINTWSQKLCALMNKFRYVEFVNNTEN